MNSSLQQPSTCYKPTIFHATQSVAQYSGTSQATRSSYPNPGQVSRRLMLPGFLDNQHMKVVILSAYRTSRFSQPREIPGFISVKRPKQHQSHSAERRSKSMKNPATQSVIKPATYQIVKQSVSRLHLRVPPSQTTCQFITKIQFTSSHTASNLILPILQNKTLKQGLI